MSDIISIRALGRQLGYTDQYDYVKFKNLLGGLKGQFTKKDIQNVRKAIKQEFAEIDKKLATLEKE